MKWYKVGRRIKRWLLKLAISELEEFIEDEVPTISNELVEEMVVTYDLTEKERDLLDTFLTQYLIRALGPELVDELEKEFNLDEEK